MKVTTIVKINPKIELTSPVLLQCKDGECGGCPKDTGKLLWISGGLINLDGTNTSTKIFNFQYNFFNNSTESNGGIKFNTASGFNTIDNTMFSYSNPPNKAWAFANEAVDNFSLSPTLMRSSDIIRDIGFTIQETGGWLFFRQPNPAIGNVHDALCFEYNHEKRLIAFRSF